MSLSQLSGLTLYSFINNEFIKGVDGKTFGTINPSTEEVIASVHEATEKDVDIAVAAARKAFEGEWRQVTPENRGKLLNNLANLFEKNIDALAAIESLDNGKAISMAKGDVGMAAGCLRYYGGYADKIHGKVIDTTPDTFNYIRKEPVSTRSVQTRDCRTYTSPDRCLRPDHPMELSYPHVVLEDRSCHCLR